MTAPIISWPSAPDNDVVRRQSFQMFDVTTNEFATASADESWVRNPSTSLARFYELQAAKDDEESPMLSQEEASKRFGMDGRLKFDSPIRESAARMMADLKQKELDRADTLSRGHGFWMKGAGIASSLAANLVDPLNLASMFIPVIGEARGAQILTGLERVIGKSAAESFLVRSANRAVVGGLEGSIGNLAVEPLTLIQAKQEQADYDFANSLENVMLGGVAGVGLRTGLGAIGEGLGAISRKTREDMFRAGLADLLENGEVRSVDKIMELDPARLRAEALNTSDLQTLGREMGFDVAKLDEVRDPIFSNAVDQKVKEIAMNKIDDLHQLQTMRAEERLNLIEQPDVDRVNLPEQESVGKTVELDKEVVSKKSDTDTFIKDNEHMLTESDLKILKEHDELVSQAEKRSRGYLQAVNCVLGNLIR